MLSKIKDMNYIIKFTDSYLENIILNVCIFLFGINFLYKANYILMVTFVLLVFFKKKKVKMGDIKSLVVLFLFFLSWSYFNDFEISGICMPLCYIIGCNVKEKADIKKLIYLLTFSLALYTTSFFINNAIVNGISNYDINGQPNIWNGKLLWPTNIMLYSSLYMGLFGYFVFEEKKLIIKILYFIIFGINAFYAMMLSRRAALLMVIISIVCISVYTLLFNGKEKRKQFIKIMLVLICVGIVAFVVLYIMYKTNFYGFKEMVMRSDLYKRFIGHGDFMFFFNDMGRSVFRKRMLDHFWEYPFGGCYLREIAGNYAHDIWLDVYDVGGIIPFVFIVLYTLLFGKSIITLLTNKNVNKSIKLLLLCLSSCILAQCCIEPILEACKAYMFALCMIHGLVDFILKEQL